MSNITPTGDQRTVPKFNNFAVGDTVLGPTMAGEVTDANANGLNTQVTVKWADGTTTTVAASSLRRL